MSNTISKFIDGMISSITLPLSTRQRKRVIARVINRLEQKSLSEVSTSKGKLHFYSLKSGFTASAVERFHEDEPETLSWIDSFDEGEIFWDIGANIGVYSLYASLINGVTVFAFEPSGFNFGLLVEHIALNKKDSQIKPLCIAFGNNTCLGNLKLSSTHTGHAGNNLSESPGASVYNDAAFNQAITAYSIDDFIMKFNLPVPNHIKLDVDGIEPLILKGAEKTLKEINSMMIEVERDNVKNFVDYIETPLKNAGLEEILEIRSMGHGRNRLFIRKQ